MQFRDSHPSNQELVLAADGELSARRVERLRKHLAGCWECRVRAQELEGAIGEFVHLHRQSLDPVLPPVSGARALLKAQLDHIVSSQPPWRRRLIPLAVAACILMLVSIIIPHRWPLQREPRMYASFVPMSFPTATLTPGVARLATKDQVCGTNQGKNRDVPVAVRRKVFELYGIPGADPKAYEVDYLITPALGGVDDVGNLWPQSYSATVWNARVKDALEDRLHEMVCRGDMDLATAQREISTDWIAAYKKYFRTDKPIN
jgi:Putative zinc-finger